MSLKWMYWILTSCPVSGVQMFSHWLSLLLRNGNFHLTFQRYKNTIRKKRRGKKGGKKKPFCVSLIHIFVSSAWFELILLNVLRKITIIPFYFTMTVQTFISMQIWRSQKDQNHSGVNIHFSQTEKLHLLTSLKVNASVSFLRKANCLNSVFSYSIC